MFNRIFRTTVLAALGVLLAVLVLGSLVMVHFLGWDQLGKVGLYFILPGLGIGAIAFFLCGVAAHLTAQKIAAPLNAIAPGKLPDKNEWPETAPLAEKLAAMQSEYLRKQEEFDLTIKYMTEGLILLDREGKVLSVNDATRRIFRLNSQAEGRDILFLYPSDTLRLLLTRAREGEHGEASLQIRKTSYQINASPIFQGGRVAGIVLLIFDITQREQAEKMRREFTANVSHELKTPLQTISGCAELLSGGMVREEDIPRFSRQIYTEARRMIALVEDIIKLSRLDEGTGEQPMEKVDLMSLAQRTAEILRPAAEMAGVQLAVQGESCMISGVPQLLEGIVYNLVDNAVKYNVENGRVDVQVSGEGHRARLTVSDTGIGIPIHQQERVFERFYRVDKSHSKQVGGTGLGLSIVKHAARLHGADIHLESQQGKGTTVTVLFPSV